MLLRYEVVAKGLEHVAQGVVHLKHGEGEGRPIPRVEVVIASKLAMIPGVDHAEDDGEPAPHEAGPKIHVEAHLISTVADFRTTALMSLDVHRV